MIGIPIGRATLAHHMSPTGIGKREGKRIIKKENNTKQPQPLLWVWGEDEARITSKKQTKNVIKTD
uniref:Uncharacterized protein n=1 Tax=Anopheles arabiensis TaxID=7173 RepID=A0A182IH30_ANOAR